mmetsp:Transcript_41622/g.114763  ORF Transcript_41622/g.114763 Transcript_41622/m.114763 type:complete len:428 (+) Transcript_41622:107-1390(+)|eukprot:CAMPEP_0117494844 /NCGR_PEP_ID=MMETSP0784-20121206/19823_1 /TAXON_ID=39447 /ORGANISM="" /LENGTH=427 /DNA_ID=CAMNT_0005289741 /DNA_START=84 /DNA_END=1367 /DNA_ORIENTATION=-
MRWLCSLAALFAAVARVGDALEIARASLKAVVMSELADSWPRRRTNRSEDVAAKHTGQDEATDRKCERYFTQCWQIDSQRWDTSLAHCKGHDGLNSKFVCGTLLCNSWLLRKCGSASLQCLAVARMCVLRDVEASHRVAELFTPGVTGKTASSIDVKALPSSETSMSKFMGERRRPSSEPVWLNKHTNGSTLKMLRGSHANSTTEMQFLHIPKNAGSAIEEAGALAGIKWGVHMDFTRVRMRDGFLCHWYHIPPDLLKEHRNMTNPYDSPAFCVVRNPYARALSEYRYLLSVDWGEAWETGLRTKAQCSPEGLNNWLQNTLARFMHGDRFINDCHMLPQMEYIQGNGRRYARWELGEVLRWEDLPEAFNKLMKSRNLKPRLAQGVAVNWHHDVCPDLRESDFDSNSRAMMNTVYYEDFATLGYRMLW